MLIWEYLWAAPSRRRRRSGGQLILVIPVQAIISIKAAHNDDGRD